ncbi:hypothetical protein NM208_g1091 [Fusarium decemcellulare]|uniref:Uncharacterized protein n=1 Tax=Fusarium decemcellulare TaxID=57161 RepID=A0ACC1SXC8_9HYPO|nr:hypothetical protein NM208_g1091 [Fusarium decemcellulare]
MKLFATALLAALSATAVAAVPTKATGQIAERDVTELMDFMARSAPQGLEKRQCGACVNGRRCCWQGHNSLKQKNLDLNRAKSKWVPLGTAIFAVLQTIMATADVARPRVPAASLPIDIPTVGPFDGEDQIDATREAQNFLTAFSNAVDRKDWASFRDLFANLCWWRDSLTLTFDKRTLRGSNEIVKAWEALSDKRKPSNFQSNKAGMWDMQPTFTRLAPVLAWLDVPFTFMTEDPKSQCCGVAKLIPQDGKWKIWVLATAVKELPEHPFHPLPRQAPSAVPVSQRGRPHAQGLPQVDGDLDAVVIGGNGSGISNAIMLDSAGANVAVFDKEVVAGGVWADRYEAVRLHHPNFMIQLPMFAVPKESYEEYLTGKEVSRYYSAAVEELKLPFFAGVLVRANTWDKQTKLWTVELEDVKSGSRTKIKAKNIIMANGYWIGEDNPYYPELADRDLFKGPVQHTSKYRNAQPYKDLDALVIGSGNSAHDVAKELTLNGAKSVTILQRSPTCLLDYHLIAPMVTMRYQGQMPVDAADFLETSLPTGAQRGMALGAIPMLIKAMGDRNKQLESKGYKLDYQPDIISRTYEERGRNLFMDHPKALDLVLNDQIKIARGEARRFDKDGVVVHDKETGEDKVISAGGVVYATGYEDVDLPKKWADTGFFDPETASCLINVNLLGVDAEGEVPGYVTFSGHPHVYFAGMGLYMMRWISRYVAVEVLADVHGKFPERYARK